MISFKKFNGSKGDFEIYKPSLEITNDDIVFIYNTENEVKYLYINGVYFSSNEIYIGKEQPTTGSVKLWVDTTDTPSLKYEKSGGVWETISSGEGNLIYIGNEKPGDDTEYKVWISPDEVIEDDEEPLIIDTELNPDSINPVQNSTITAEFNKYLKKTDAEAFITEDEVAKVAFTGNFNDLVNIPDFTLTHIGEEEPEINSDFNRWINPNEDSFDGVDVYNALIEYVNTKFKAIDDVLELIIGEEI
jgi:hypothetical protein